MKTNLSDLATGCYEKRLFAFMRATGIGTITLEYSGGGDSGCIDSRTVCNAEGKCIASPEWIHKEEHLEKPIWDKHGSFADGGGFFVSGAVEWNAINGTVEMSGTEYTDVYPEVDSEDEEAQELAYDSEHEQETLEWCDVLYDSGWLRGSAMFNRLREGKVSSIISEEQGFDVHFLLLYAKCVQPLPKEMHLRVVAEAICNPKSVELIEYMRLMPQSK